MNEYNDKGKKHGRWKTDEYEVHYHNGLFHGTFEYYYNNGHLSLRGNFNIGKACGLFESFNFSSQIISKRFYI